MTAARTALPLTLPRLEIHVPGIPIPQGSKIAVRRGRTITLVDDNANDLKPWRADITRVAGACMRIHGWRTLDGPIRCTLTFRFLRPASMKNRTYPHVRPDADKLARAVNDSLTAAGVWVDDARVVQLNIAKRYVDRQPGVIIVVEPMEDQ